VRISSASRVGRLCRACSAGTPGRRRGR
jgi:hypothetical protein